MPGLFFSLPSLRKRTKEVNGPRASFPLTSPAATDRRTSIRTKTARACACATARWPDKPHARPPRGPPEGAPGRARQDRTGGCPSSPHSRDTKSGARWGKEAFSPGVHRRRSNVGHALGSRLADLPHPPPPKKGGPTDGTIQDAVAHREGISGSRRFAAQRALLGLVSG